MKNYNQNYANDIHLIRASQNFIAHNLGHQHPDHSNHASNANAHNVHSYIVDWQIPKDAKQKNL